MPNVKLGNDTLNGVNTVRLQSADGGVKPDQNYRNQRS